MRSELVVQGLASEYNKPIAHGDKIIVLLSGCFDKSIRNNPNVKLLFDHNDSKSLSCGEMKVYSGAKYLAFRYYLPDDAPDAKELSEVCDELETYVGVSIGMKYIDFEHTTIDGVPLIVVKEAVLEEISLLHNPPAVSSTYARIASVDPYASLQEDYDAGLLEAVGRFVSLHRKTVATENGKVTYNHSPSPYNRAASNFERSLEKLAL